MPFLIAVMFALAALSADAATGTSALPFSEYIHTAFTQHDGVPIGRVRKILQTSDGYLWVMTVDEGLLRFDGMRFVRPPTPCRETVRLAATAADGGLWAICGQQLIRRTADGEFVEVPQTFLPQQYPRPMWLNVDRLGRPWFFFDETTRYLEADGAGGGQIPRPTPDRVRAAALDVDGTLWASDMGQVVHVFPDRREVITMGPVWCLIPARDGGVFAMGEERAWRVRQGAEPVPIDAITGISVAGADTCLAEAADGSLWVGTDQYGLALVRDGRLETRSDTGLLGRSVEAVFVDREGSIWAGANGALHRFRRPVVQIMDTLSRRLTSVPTFLFDDSAENLWLSPTEHRGIGRLRLTDGTWASLPRREHDYWAIGEDETGRIWVSDTYDLGYVADGKIVIVHDSANARIRSVNSLRQDSRGHLWGIASNVGLYRITPGPPQLVIPHPNASSDFLVSDRFGIWITRQGPTGVEQHIDGRVNVFPYPYYTGVIVEDGDAIWFATSGGLKRWRLGQWTTWTEEHGLPAGGVGLTILPDRSGRLWMMADNALLVVPRAQLDETPDGAPRRLSFAQIGNMDGVIPPSGGSGPSPHAGVDRQGRMYFATYDSVVTVDPATVVEARLAPSIVIESVTVDNQPIDLRSTEPLVEPSRLRFDFTSLELGNPEMARFRYHLDGYDPGWNDAGVQRSVTYGTLRPGSYRFRVVGAGAEGVWNETGASYSFRIVPVFWRTWWFRIAVLACIALIVSGLYQFRVRQLTRQFTVALDARVTERTRIARELHDTLLQTFQGVLIHFKVAANALPGRPEDAKRKLESVLDQGARAITEARDAVKALRSPSGVSDDLAKAIGVLGDELALEHSGAPSATVRVHVEGRPRSLRPILRDDVYRIASEAVRNAMHHARANAVQVDIHYDARHLRVRVRDDGKGLDPTVLADRAAAGHWGLPGMRERAELIGGTLEVRSRLGAGTEIDLSVPAFKAYAGQSAGKRFWSRKTEHEARL